jgi:Mrp family chromosome partitioning ATPase
VPRIGSDGRGYDAQPAYVAEVVGASPAAQRRSQPAERSTALARVEPAPQVLTFDVSTGWHPDASLDVSLRYALRDELIAHYQGRCFVVGVSAGPDLSEQKSRLAVELALALAERERTRVLILEADFQRPSVHRLARAKLPLGSGFSQQLHLRASAGAASEGIPSQWMVARCNAQLDVLGESAMRAPGLMATPKFETCIAELRRFYDFIVVDGPPLSMTDESRALDRLVDGMLFFSTGSNDPAMARLSTLFSGKVFSKVVKRG